jgi:hypothetical protein
MFNFLSNFGKQKKSRKKSTGSLQRMKSLAAKHLAIEPLEKRELLAVFHWDGGGSDHNWGTAENWDGDQAPVAGDALVFNNGTNRDTVNNTSFTYNSIRFGADGFSIANNNILTLTSGITVDENVTDSVITGASMTINSLTVNSGGSLTMSGVMGSSLLINVHGSGSLSIGGLSNPLKNEQKRVLFLFQAAVS